MAKHLPLLIIGAGPCGLAMATYARQAQGQDPRAGHQWTVPEMWLSPCVGCGSRNTVGAAKPTTFQKLLHSLSRHKLN
jgi:2-polyprenyl-6-methoxyphenol hydroxylase-like FAD-dependent oxidoreductase